MPFPKGPMSDERKAAIMAGQAAAHARRLAGDPPVKKARRPYVRRVLPPDSQSAPIIMSDPTIGSAPAPVLPLILDELRAIRGLLDLRLPRWSMSPAMPEPQAKAAEEIAEKVTRRRATILQLDKKLGSSDRLAPLTPDGSVRVSRETSAYQAERDRAVVAAVEAAERVPMPAPRPPPPALIYNESPITDAPEVDDDLGDDPAADLAAELAELSALDDLPPAPPDEESVWRPRLEMYKYGMWVEHEWGSPPGRSGCLAPDWLLEDMGLAKAVAR